MATRALLAELAHAAARQGLATAQIESVGGVDAARRVQAGEAFDLVFLAADAIELLLEAGHLQVAERLRQAPAGVPVARLVATGEVALGFQQRSELLGAEGIQLVGDLPAAVAITTVFSAGLGAGTVQGDAARALLAFFNSPEAVAVKRRHGMEPA
jgi:ABC-type molybdate transport system substrate-binding protein